MIAPVLLHELTHWTGHSTRLDRLKSGKFGDKDYAFEELVAELGSAFQCNLLGIEAEPREDHAQYIKSWLTALNNDATFIFEAAKHAQRAVDHIQYYHQEAYA